MLGAHNTKSGKQALPLLLLECKTVLEFSSVYFSKGRGSGSESRPVLLDFKRKVDLIVQQLVVIEEHYPPRAVASRQHATRALKPVIARNVHSRGIGAGSVRSKHGCVIRHFYTHFIHLKQRNQHAINWSDSRRTENATHRVHKLQSCDDFMLGLECNLQPVRAALLQHERFGLQVAHFALVGENVDDVASRPVLKLQTEFGGNNLPKGA